MISLISGGPSGSNNKNSTFDGTPTVRVDWCPTPTHPPHPHPPTPPHATPPYPALPHPTPSRPTPSYPHPTLPEVPFGDGIGRPSPQAPHRNMAHFRQSIDVSIDVALRISLASPRNIWRPLMSRGTWPSRPLFTRLSANQPVVPQINPVLPLQMLEWCRDCFCGTHAAQVPSLGAWSTPPKTTKSHQDPGIHPSKRVVARSLEVTNSTKKTGRLRHMSPKFCKVLGASKDPGLRFLAGCPQIPCCRERGNHP